MKVESWIVTEQDARPVGRPDECFYCKTPMGEEHKQGCVIRTRTVVMDVTIRLVREVPEDWNVDLINFSWNEGSWCAGNIVDVLDKINTDDHCLCSQFEAEYVREATAEDEVELGHTKGFSANGQRLLEGPTAVSVGPGAVSVPEPNEQNAVDARPAEESVPRGTEKA